MSRGHQRLKVTSEWSESNYVTSGCVVTFQSLSCDLAALTAGCPQVER